MSYFHFISRNYAVLRVYLGLGMVRGKFKCCVSGIKKASISWLFNLTVLITDAQLLIV